jgi:flavin-dependent dehydrogenase
MASRLDVAIVGGGPAGAATAMVLLRERPDLQVAIFEAGCKVPVRRPLEVLAPGGRTLLEHCGAWAQIEPFLTPVFASSALWGGPQLYENQFIFSARGPAYYIERGSFDARLRQQAGQLGATIIDDATFVDVERAANGGWALQLTSAQATGIETWSTSFIVDATGRRAAVARRCDAKSLRFDSLVGIGTTWTSCVNADSLGAAILVESDEYGWWYSARTGNCPTVIFMTDANLARARGLRQLTSWLRALAGTRQTFERVAEAVPELPLFVRSARTRRLDRAGGNRWIAVGDAAASFDPLSSSGVLSALRSGTIGAFAILDALRGVPSGIEIYQRAIDAEFRAYLVARREFYSAERRWPRSSFWAERSTMIKSTG